MHAVILPLLVVSAQQTSFVLSRVTRCGLRNTGPNKFRKRCLVPWALSWIGRPRREKLTSGFLLADMAKLGGGCFAMPALLASVPTEKRTHEATV